MHMTHAHTHPYSDYMLGLALKLVTLLSLDHYDPAEVSALVTALEAHLEHKE